MAEEVFNKTPKKANRWFKAFLVFAVLYGATFSLWGFFNWIFFCAAVYSLFMSYFLLPVQPKVFQSRPRGTRQTNYTNTGGAEQSTPEQRQRKVVIGIIGGVFALFFIFFVVGIISSVSEDATDSGPESPTEDSPDSDSPASNNSQDYVTKGNDFFNNQQYDSADIYYDRAMTEDASNMEAVYGKGIVRYNQGNIAEANQYFQQAYNGGFRYAWLSWALADMNDKNGDVSTAITLYKESVNLDSSYVDSFKRLAELEPANKDLYLQLAEKHKGQ